MVGNIVFPQRGELVDQIRLNGHESIVLGLLFFPTVCCLLLVLARALVSVHSLTVGQHCCVLNQSKAPFLKTVPRAGTAPEAWSHEERFLKMCLLD